MNKILVTYDLSKEAKKKFYERVGHPYIIQFSDMGPADILEALFKKLAEKNVEIVMLSHDEFSDIEKTSDNLAKLCDSSDLIFHESSMVAREYPNTQWKEDYIAAIEHLILDRYIQKSQFWGIDFHVEKDRGMEIARQHGIPIPRTWTVEEYLASSRELPIVLKHIQLNGGDSVFYFDRPKQIEIFLGEGLYPKGVGPIIKNHIVQEFIDTPSNHFTNYRIVTLSDGSIVAAAINISGKRKDQLKRLREPGPFYPGRSIHDCIDSPYFLDRYDITSNVFQGGHSVPLGFGPRNLGEDDIATLHEHYIDVSTLDLPTKLKELAIYTAKVFARYGFIISAQDWIQDDKGNFYLLENNYHPSMSVFDACFNKSGHSSSNSVEIGTDVLSDNLIRYMDQNKRIDR
jgi:hypothetical protein